MSSADARDAMLRLMREAPDAAYAPAKHMVTARNPMPAAMQVDAAEHSGLKRCAKICMTTGTQFVILKDGKEWKGTIIEAVNTKSNDGKLKLLWSDGQLDECTVRAFKDQAGADVDVWSPEAKKPAIRTGQDVIAAVGMPPAMLSPGQQG